MNRYICSITIDKDIHICNRINNFKRLVKILIVIKVLVLQRNHVKLC